MTITREAIMANGYRAQRDERNEWIVTNGWDILREGFRDRHEAEVAASRLNGTSYD